MLRIFRDKGFQFVQEMISKNYYKISVYLKKKCIGNSKLFIYKFLYYVIY